MYHVILIALVATLMLAVWNLVHYAPRALALFLPPQITFAAGAFLIVFGIFFAFAAAVNVQNGAAMVAFMLKAHVGLWLMLTPYRSDEAVIRRAFVLMGALVATIVAVYYVQDPAYSALLMVILVAFGGYVVRGNIPFLDRGS